MTTRAKRPAAKQRQAPATLPSPRPKPQAPKKEPPPLAELAKALREQVAFVLVPRKSISHDHVTKTPVLALFHSGEQYPPAYALLDLESSATRAFIAEQTLESFPFQSPDRPGALETPQGLWSVAILGAGAAAILEAAAVVLTEDFELSQHTNMLTAVSNIVATGIRRELLRRVLMSFGWNLTRVAKALNMGSAGNVTRAIRDLGLGPEYQAMRRSGRVARLRPGPKPQGSKSKVDS